MNSSSKNGKKLNDKAKLNVKKCRKKQILKIKTKIIQLQRKIIQNIKKVL